MGGAFIGVADDATAASWNPAGLIQLEKPEVSLVYSTMKRDQTYHSTLHPEINSSNSMDTDGINYAAIAYPFQALGRNMVFSLNYQRMYEMNKKVAFNYKWDLGGGSYKDDTIAFYQKGYLYALSPALAVQVRPAFSLGATLNFWRNNLGLNGWENTYRSSGTGNVLGNSFTDNVVWKMNSRFEGVNANLGALWNVTDAFAIGGVYKTPFDGKIKQEQYFYQSQVLGGTPTVSPPQETSNDLTMKMPASMGLGFQYRQSDTLTLALDLYRTQWSQFLIKDPSGNEINPLDGKPISDGRLMDTMQVRLGAEYLFIGNNSTIALRAGVFSDPEPSRDKEDKFYGMSLGTGYSTGKFAVDASYQYRQGKDVDGDIAYVQPKSVDITQHTVMLSGIYYY
jgi:long-subunit fatty acid transport protein